MIHYGHLNLLKKASQLGDVLIVGVSTDECVEAKGKKTVFQCDKRMEYIADLKYVDKVIPEHDMGQKVDDIKKYHVDIFLLGDDYAETFLQMPEYHQIKKMCKIVFLPRTPNISTTMLKENLKN